jgi:hypothetical protein
VTVTSNDDLGKRPDDHADDEEGQDGLPQGPSAQDPPGWIDPFGGPDEPDPTFTSSPTPVTTTRPRGGKTNPVKP